MKLTPEYESLVLNKMKISVRKAFSPHMIDKIKFDSCIDIFSGNLVMELSAYLLSNKIHKEIIHTEKVYDSWFQLFKKQCFPEWLLKKFPAKSRNLDTEINFIHICPHLSYPENSDTVHLAFLKERK